MMLSQIHYKNLKLIFLQNFQINYTLYFMKQEHYSFIKSNSERNRGKHNNNV